MTLALIFFGALLLFYLVKMRRPDLSHLPESFVVFDFETTGLNPESHEIIEIGAIRVNRDSYRHETFQAFVKPRKEIPKKIRRLTKITQKMVDKEGYSLEEILPLFLEFVGNRPLVAFNANFDISFLETAMAKTGIGCTIRNKVSCALKMSRRAWPGRQSYSLANLAKDGGLSMKGNHRALGDCKRTLRIYLAAANKLRKAR